MSRVISKSEIHTALQAFGYVQVETTRVGDYDQFILDFVSTFARPISYFGQPLVMNVTPKEGASPASYAGTASLDLHTDITWFSSPPKYIIMMCISLGSGGVPIISDGWRAITSLNREIIHTLETQEIEFAAPPHVNHSGYTGPALTKADGMYRVRFRSDLLRGPITSAMSSFNEAAYKCVTQLNISPGSLWVIDNFRMLHGRGKIEESMPPRRFLKRVYATGDL